MGREFPGQGVKKMFQIIHVFVVGEDLDVENGPSEACLNFDSVPVMINGEFPEFETKELAETKLAELKSLPEWKNKDLEIQDLSCPFCNNHGCYACSGPEIEI